MFCKTSVFTQPPGSAGGTVLTGSSPRAIRAPVHTETLILQHCSQGYCQSRHTADQVLYNPQLWNKRHFSDPRACFKLIVRFVLTEVLMLPTLPAATAAGLSPSMPHLFYLLLDVLCNVTQGSQSLPQHCERSALPAAAGGQCGCCQETSKEWLRKGVQRPAGTWCLRTSQRQHRKTNVQPVELF